MYKLKVRRDFKTVGNTTQDILKENTAKRSTQNIFKENSLEEKTLEEKISEENAARGQAQDPVQNAFEENTPEVVIPEENIPEVVVFEENIPEENAAQDPVQNAFEENINIPKVKPGVGKNSKKEQVVATCTKRLVTEYKRIVKNPELKDFIKVNHDNLLEWYFMIRTDDECESIFFAKHADNYPFSPPVVKCLTPNGVFKTAVPLCLSFTHYHPEDWDPSMTNEKIYYGLSAYYGLVKEGKAHGMGVHRLPENDRAELAKQSFEYNTNNISKKVSNLFYYKDSPLWNKK